MTGKDPCRRRRGERPAPAAVHAQAGGLRRVDRRRRQEALRLWQPKRPALILLDVSLPKLDGYGVAEKIRAEEGAGATSRSSCSRPRRRSSRRSVACAPAPTTTWSSPSTRRSCWPACAACWPASRRATARVGRPPLGRMIAFYGAKGGVGTTTIAINTAIALHASSTARSCLVDGVLQFGDHRVFLDLGHDRKSIIDLVTRRRSTRTCSSRCSSRHDSGVDLLLAPPSPEEADLVTPEHLPPGPRDAPGDVRLRGRRRRQAPRRPHPVGPRPRETIHIVMTADLSCLKNVRLVLEALRQIGFDSKQRQARPQPLERVHGHQRRRAESALKRRVRDEDHERVPAARSPPRTAARRS